MSSKIIEIKRHYGFVQAANANEEVKGYFDMAYKAVGAYYKDFGKVHASGLSRAEENLLMPELLGVYPEDRKEFRTAVNDYFKNMNTKIPAEGLKLEIGFEGSNSLGLIDKDGKPTGNMPIKISDYVRYKHAVGHPKVADTLEAAERMGQLAEFYLVDRVEESKKRSSINKLEDDAMQKYYEVKEDNFKIDQMLVNLGVAIKTLDKGEKEVKLKQLATIDSEQTDTANKNRLKRFIDLAEDKNLELKYRITEMIRVGILNRVHTKILDPESGETLGANLQETVGWFKDKSNNQDVNTYNASLEHKGGIAMPDSSYANNAKPEKDKGAPVTISDSDLSDFDEKEDNPKSTK